MKNMKVERKKKAAHKVEVLQAMICVEYASNNETKTKTATHKYLASDIIKIVLSGLKPA